MASDARKILLVEDEKAIRDAVAAYLEREGYWVVGVGDGQSAVEEFEKHQFDLIVLDLMLPKLSGERVCRAIRDTSDVPIIMLTAKGEVEDRIIGLELGADDYLIKPFSAKELFARIRALSRRPDHEIKGEIISFEDVSFNTKKNMMQTPENEYKLSVKEAKILEMLLKRPNQVFTREQILDRVWGFDKEVNENNIEIYVHNLRKKLANTNVKIDTIRGVGYTLSKK